MNLSKDIFTTVYIHMFRKSFSGNSYTDKTGIVFCLVFLLYIWKKNASRIMESILSCDLKSMPWPKRTILSVRATDTAFAHPSFTAICVCSPNSCLATAKKEELYITYLFFTERANYIIFYSDVRWCNILSPISCVPVWSETISILFSEYFAPF